MPSIDSLMREWPPEFEELLKEVSLPSPELDVDLNTYADILCALLDIPVYKSRVQSIHALLNLFSEFKNSEVVSLFYVSCRLSCFLTVFRFIFAAL